MKAKNRAKEGRAEGPLVLSAKQDRGPDRRREDQDSNLLRLKKVQTLWASTPRNQPEERGPLISEGRSFYDIDKNALVHQPQNLNRTQHSILLPLFETEVLRYLSFLFAQLLAQPLTWR